MIHRVFLSLDRMPEGSTIGMEIPFGKVLTMAAEQTDCIFCKIIAGQIPCYKVYENQSVFAFMDIGPVSDGHTLLLPKGHYERLDQCPPEILAQIALAAGPIAKAIIAATNAPAYNVLCNNGSQAGQVVKHLHFHIIPRRDNDKVFDRWNAFKYAQGKAEEFLQKIKENMII
jgi:histidine triad (HIT) family protein